MGIKYQTFCTKICYTDIAKQTELKLRQKGYFYFAFFSYALFEFGKMQIPQEYACGISVPYFRFVWRQSGFAVFVR